jgi:hypothetical protein
MKRNSGGGKRSGDLNKRGAAKPDAGNADVTVSPPVADKRGGAKRGVTKAAAKRDVSQRGATKGGAAKTGAKKAAAGKAGAAKTGAIKHPDKPVSKRGAGKRAASKSAVAGKHEPIGLVQGNILATGPKTAARPVRPQETATSIASKVVADKPEARKIRAGAIPLGAAPAWRAAVHRTPLRGTRVLPADWLRAPPASKPDSPSSVSAQSTAADPARRKKRQRREELVFPAPEPVSLGAIGMESEFTVLLDGLPVKPEDVFKSPTNIVRAPMMHRSGRSYHLPTGGAVYFDTGVIEIATGMIEIEKGCAARAGRSLWENVRYLREELDDWEKRHGHDVELQGFSTHYNISFSPRAKERRGAHRSVGKLALLLTYILPAPVMLLAANRRSTGVGVRPRGNRVEVTADFTPDPSLMIATGTLCVGIIRAVMNWPSYELSELSNYLRELPMIRGVHPVPHSSRKGWSAKYTCYPENPFIQDIDEPMWATTGGERLSLREIAGRVTKFFWPSIQRFSDPFTLRLIGSVMRGRAPSLLELDDRPPGYDSVGRLVQWDDLFPERVLPRSRYERVLGHAISGERLRLDREVYTPVGMQGWAHVVFRKDSDKSRHVLSLDYLLDHLDEWDSGAR